MTKYLVKSGGGKAAVIETELAPSYQIKYGGGKAALALTELSPTYSVEVITEEAEEQTEHNFGWGISSATFTRAGQKLTISSRQVTNLGFWLLKMNNPTGDVTLTIRKVSDGSLISSKVWGDAADLTADPVYEEVEFDTPQTINEEVRILTEFSGGNATNQVKVRMQGADVKADEEFCAYEYPDWTDYPAYDCAYRYKYTT